MAFQALYRKYRPQRFGELVGQEHITTSLRHAVRDGRIGHAYLFSGPRGNGKTTTARILAKALNCLQLEPDGEPCGQCENCVSISAGTFGDLIEMDAASNRGVDDARDLVARISLGLGATSKRKVYLLDEVHMLTKDAANTLLKSIEEPPAHVVFILATTEPEKVLATIRSRTQHFEFKYLTVDELTGLLASVLGDEGVAFETDALVILARAAAGSARDAESLLDLVLAGGEAVTVASVESALGGAPFEMRMAILEAIAAEDAAGVLIAVAALLEAAHDPRRIAEGLLASLRDAFITLASGGRVSIDEPDEIVARLRSVGEAMGNAAMVRGLETLGQALIDMRGTDAADPRLVLEIALVRLARRESTHGLQTLADRVDRLEARLADGPQASASPTVTSAPAGAPPALGGLRKARAAADAGVAASDLPRGDTPPTIVAIPPLAVDLIASVDTVETVGAAESAEVAETPAVTTFELDDVIVAWATVLATVPRSLQTSIMEAQPVRVDGNVIVFGVARTHLDAVKPKFQRDADAIREAFIRELGSAPRFSFTAHEWANGDGPPHRRAAEVVSESPPEEEEHVDLFDPEELVDAPITEGAAVDSVSRLADAFGATVVEEQPKA